MFCPNCGAEAPDGARLCGRCGTRLEPAPATISPTPPPPAPPPLPAEVETVQPQSTFPMGTASPTGVHDAHDELWQGGYSPKAMLGPIVSAVLITIAALIGSLIFANSVVTLILLGIVALAWLGVLVMFATRRLGVHYRLTTQRFFHEHGILRRITDRMEVIAIDDISVEQGPIERLLGIGTIKVRSNDDTEPTFVLQGIDDVQRVADIIDEARRAERNRRSVRMEQI